MVNFAMKVDEYTAGKEPKALGVVALAIDRSGEYHV